MGASLKVIQSDRSAGERVHDRLTGIGARLICRHSNIVRSGAIDIGRGLDVPCVAIVVSGVYRDVAKDRAFVLHVIHEGIRTLDIRIDEAGKASRGADPASNLGCSRSCIRSTRKAPQSAGSVRAASGRILRIVRNRRVDGARGRRVGNEAAVPAIGGSGSAVRVDGIGQAGSDVVGEHIESAADHLLAAARWIVGYADARHKLPVGGDIVIRSEWSKRFAKRSLSGIRLLKVGSAAAGEQGRELRNANGLVALWRNPGMRRIVAAADIQRNVAIERPRILYKE